MIVVDTSVMIDHLRRVPAARTALRRELAMGTPVMASVLSRTEVLRGMRAGEQRATRDLFASLRWASVTSEIADAAGHLARRHRTSHHGIDPIDFVIAATAIEAGAELWTRNVRHFPMFDGLTPPY